MDILVTGGSGQVGTELQRQAWPEGVRLHAPARAELDLADAEAIDRVLAARPWAAIISSGAYTAVDKAETEVVQAWRVNALAPALLARRSAERGIPIVHVSTDYVFPGSKDGYYREDDPVGPLGVYGASKEGGEQAVRTGNPRHAIIRTAWVVSPHGSNFLKTMLRLAGSGREELGVVSDQRGCPTFAGDLAAALARVTLDLVRSPDAPAGTFHFVNAGEASWAGFAEAIFAASARRGGPSARVKAISTAEYPTPARRPANSRLATDRIRDAFGIAPRPWQDALEEAVAALQP
ncbi:dTDP-4-dehydrorhamnose reductase [Enterovirga aerilata]|uniref:dTDP-4-dehydrorhamnose reductase n=1 Tax=Enterovirga aerilata TaxID=2730920 RepID=A0A849I9Z9_9HYPH|nr:dTDP-4-dehydrorhamnose reductase [Enterovirga sp. DB1703]NNM73095.1 dTDP-4-dehydrorhamnose reductase [Enterovirga sp. DB1703]